MKPSSRRSFLAGAAATVVAPAIRARAQATGGEFDVIIVGAGAAGIAAARKMRAQSQRFVLVEASDRIGGRCFTDTRSFGVPFDRGAHLIHAPDINPVLKLAARTGLEVYPAPSGQRMRIGRRNAREGELEDFLATLVRCHRAIVQAGRGANDVSCLRALPGDLGDWRASIEFALGPNACGKDLSEISAQDYARSVERDVGAFCRQGYGALLAKLAEGLPVRLGTPVTEVDLFSRDARVEAKTADGSLLGRYIIVTASTNVLTSGRIRFTREEPRRQLDAAARLRLGSSDHIALELAGNPLGLQRDDPVLERAQGPRTAALLANVSGSSLALVDVGGRFGRELSARGEPAMVEFAVEWLAGLFGAEVKKAVRRTAATRWNAEPWVLGAISTAAPGAQPARHELMEPFRDRLFFAGEAAHETLWGTVGGAWESGERAADAVLRRLGGIKDIIEEKKPEPARPRPPRRKRAPRNRSRY
jgi:monoamine oxidase